MVEYGNNYWSLRDRHGPQTKFKTAQDLKTRCSNYFDNVLAISNKEVLNFTKRGVDYSLEVTRREPMKLQDLFRHLKIHPSSWHRWRKERDDLKTVIAWVEDEIFLYNLHGVLNRHFPVSVLNNDFYLSRLLKCNDIPLHKKRLPKVKEHGQEAVA